jgi:uncharacterized membrane protein HdeD (DUF308 family)
MLGLMARHWWLILLRGLFAVLFGVLALIWPGITLITLVILYGAYALVDGITAIAAAIRAAEHQMQWWSLLLRGIVGIAAGIVAFVWPGLTALVLLFIIAFWAIATGVMEIVAAIRLREAIANEWLLGLGGLISILFGVLLIVNPGAGALSVVWLIGAFALIFGIMQIALAFRLRGIHDRLSGGQSAF